MHLIRFIDNNVCDCVAYWRVLHTGELVHQSINQSISIF